MKQYTLSTLPSPSTAFQKIFTPTAIDQLTKALKIYQPGNFYLFETAHPLYNLPLLSETQNWPRDIEDRDYDVLVTEALLGDGEFTLTVEGKEQGDEGSLYVVWETDDEEHLPLEEVEEVEDGERRGGGGGVGMVVIKPPPPCTTPTTQKEEPYQQGFMMKVRGVFRRGFAGVASAGKRAGRSKERSKERHKEVGVENQRPTTAKEKRPENRRSSTALGWTKREEKGVEVEARRPASAPALTLEVGGKGFEMAVLRERDEREAT